MTTPASRPVSMILRNYNSNLVIDAHHRWEGCMRSLLASKMNHLIPILAVIIAGISGCHSNPPEKTAASPEVIRDTIGSNLQGWKDGVLPEASWPNAVKKLRPIRIYTDRVNIVIALSQQDHIESGYYVYISISSHLPISDKEWTFSAIGEDIWTYKRKLGEQ